MKSPSPSVYNATLVERLVINPTLLTLRIQADGPRFPFVPGQFAVLGLQGEAPRLPEADPEDPPTPPHRMIRRAYSIASGTSERNHLEFFVTLVNSGQLTPRLFALKPGDRLFLGPKASGLFTMDRVPVERSVLLIATGTGLAPYVSMLRSLVIHQPKRRFVVLHGARHTWDLGYRTELEGLTRLCPHFSYIPSITRPEENDPFTGPVGRIQNLIEQGVIEDRTGLQLDPARIDVFLCGNPDMIEAVKALLQESGFVADHGREVGNIHVEQYW